MEDIAKDTRAWTENDHPSTNATEYHGFDRLEAGAAAIDRK